MSDSALVRMEKAGETLLVHPTCVAAHLAAGWRVSAQIADEPVMPPTARKRKAKAQE